MRASGVREGICSKLAGVAAAALPIVRRSLGARFVWLALVVWASLASPPGRRSLPQIASLSAMGSGSPLTRVSVMGSPSLARRNASRGSSVMPSLCPSPPRQPRARRLKMGNTYSALLEDTEDTATASVLACLPGKRALTCPGCASCFRPWSRLLRSRPQVEILLGALSGRVSSRRRRGKTPARTRTRLPERY